MKNPNGYGSVVRLSGNRRNPFAVRKTVGWNEKGHPIYKTIGYYPTREEGLIALATFNQHPYDIDAARVTTQELYDKMLGAKQSKLSKATVTCLRKSWKHCAAIARMKYRDVRAYHMQACIDGCGHGHATQSHIKNLFYHLDNYAMELDVIQKRYSDLTTCVETPDSTRTPFTDAEVDALWQLAGDLYADMALVMLYAGWRIGELIALRVEDVDMENGTFKGGLKTKAGKDRIVPIHHLIMPIVQRRLQTASIHLFECGGAKINATAIYKGWNMLMERVGTSHTPHECRHTFRTRLDSAGANAVCIDLMMGHKSNSVGERVYTHKTLDELRTAIELVTR